MSDKFVVTLPLDRGLQRKLLLVPAAALAIGFVIALRLPLAAEWRIVAALAWLIWQGRELYQIARRGRSFRRLRFSGSTGIQGLSERGQAVDLRLCAGTFVKDHYLWLRLQNAEGQRCDTLLLACRLSAADWRRLQVILHLSP